MNDILKCDSIVPVTFAPGSGGHFLCKFIMSAKFKSTNLISIDPIFGHAHNKLKDAGMLDIILNRLFTDPMLMINKLKNELDNRSDISSTLPPPYYQPCHISDINLLKQYFVKVIKISYLEKDITDIAKIKIIKNNKFSTDFENLAVSIYNESLLLNIHRLNFISTDTDDNILTISWDILLYNDPNILVEKLSKFTGYPVEDFSIPDLLFWRKLTEDVLNLVNINTV